MCIAIYSKRGNELPTKDILNRCYIQNPDGAGFAYSYNGCVHIHKGFFNFEKFYDALTECDQAYNLKEQGVLLHFRIKTHGKLNAGNCHPFPLTHKEKKLKACSVKSEYAIVHNGIISCCAQEAKGSDLSDTALFVKDYLSRIAAFQGWFHNPQTIPLIEKMIDSKMAILHQDGSILSTSGFHKGSDGNYYSNYSYLEREYDPYGFSLFRDWYMREDEEPSMCIPLMRLKSGEAVYFEDDSIEEYEDSYHSSYPTFVTEMGEVYMLLENGGFRKEIPMEQLSFIGNGVIFNSASPLDEEGLAALAFRRDAMAVL